MMELEAGELRDKPTTEVGVKIEDVRAFLNKGVPVPSMEDRPRPGGRVARRLSVGSGIGRRVPRREWKAATRYMKTLARTTPVMAGERICIPGPEGQDIYFLVVSAGWFSARYVDVETNRRKYRRVAIDTGAGSAAVVPDLAMSPARGVDHE